MIIKEDNQLLIVTSETLLSTPDESCGTYPNGQVQFLVMSSF